MRIQWSLLAGLLFALITAIFAVINVEPVQVNLLFGTFDVPLILLILGCTVLGALIVGSYSIYLQYKMQRKIKMLEQQLAHVIDATGYLMPTEALVPTEEDSTNKI
ncbi:LapA family protein [Paenibacillus sp. 481]|uniref:LapA family protein n=1 Tax=Paenibacillus sp. 481 TaxID=2835869 RepID=UPI001E4CE251|nr:lipopolysaccharide assembly protein LapA domain-containing protein [Paenibacillus sp. 481]UHA72587.1 DUF1049 domain-containing protein [Paenibacillus sp. 481]